MRSTALVSVHNPLCRCTGIYRIHISDLLFFLFPPSEHSTIGKMWGNHLLPTPPYEAIPYSAMLCSARGGCAGARMYMQGGWLGPRGFSCSRICSECMQRTSTSFSTGEKNALCFPSSFAAASSHRRIVPETVGKAEKRCSDIRLEGEAHMAPLMSPLLPKRRAPQAERRAM